MSRVVDTALQRRASRHEVVARLAQRALAGADLAELFADAAATVGEVTGTDTGVVRAWFDEVRSGSNAAASSGPSGVLLDGDDTGFARAVADVLAAAVAADRARDDARRQTLHDPITGLPNRALAADRLARALVDIDGMAELRPRNPSAADATLRALSRLLREGLRGADKGGRFADDQLLLLLPGRSADDVLALLERTRRLWRRVRPEPLTLSAGVGIVDDRGAQFSLVAVDQALGHTRDAGGDRVDRAD